MNKKKSCRMLILILGILGSLTGCGMSAKEAANLRDFEKEALAYYEEKYGAEITLESCNYIYTEPGLFFPQRTKNMKAVCSDGTTILYQVDSDRISDDRQAEQINTALEDAFYARLDAIAVNMEEGQFVVDSFISFNYNDDLSGSTYHAYYDGDIDEYLQKETVGLATELFLLCQREDSWEDAQSELNQMITQDFSSDSWVKLTVLSRDCYEKYEAGDYRYPGIDMLECYAEYEMGANPCSYIQHYIKLADGIYATSWEKDFVLEEGDLTLVESISEEELNQLIFTNYNALPDVAEENKNGTYMVDDKQHVTYYIVDAETPIYQIRFSQRIKELYGEEFTVYLRFVPGELGLSTDKKLYYFPMGGKQNYYNAYSIHSDYADAEFATLNESNYYFGGTQTKQED